MADGILLGKAGTAPVELLARMANRHGLIAGATGTGKTVTLRVIAEQMSRQGVPCFVADVKGDLAGLARPAAARHALGARPAAALAPARPVRCAGGGALSRLQGGRRQRPASARLEGPAVAVALRRREARRDREPLRQGLLGLARVDPA